MFDPQQLFGDRVAGQAGEQITITPRLVGAAEGCDCGVSDLPHRSLALLGSSYREGVYFKKGIKACRRS
jgi:hypothetical protein